MSNTNNNMQTETSSAFHNAIMEAGGKDRPLMLAPGTDADATPVTPGNDGTPHQQQPRIATVSKDIQKWITVEAEVVQIILTRIDNDIYSTVDACLMQWRCEKQLKDGDSLNSYYSRFYKMMNVLVRNQFIVTNHQVNIQFLLQLKLEWQRFVTIVKQNQDLKNVSYHKLYEILKQNQNEVNKIRAERLARINNLLALVAQQQLVYHPQPNPTYYTKSSLTRSQAATRNRGKAIANSPTPTYDLEPEVVTDDEASSKEKDINKLMALISISFKKNYKPTNNNLKTSSNTKNTNVDNTLRSNKETGYSAYHKENMLMCKQEESGIRLSAEQADWKDDTYDEPEDQELEAHYMYMAKIQEVTPDAAENSGPIFDVEPLQKVHNSDDYYNVFANERQHPEQPESVNDTYLVEQSDTNITSDSSDMSNNG
ncbi:hypothetical protein Tco_1541400 [Tanacetum coccineum]